MRSRVTTSVLVGLLAGVAAASGCCTSMARANAMARDLRRQNRLRAEPAMQAAARQVGAQLLPVLPEEVFDCDLPGWPIAPGGHCLQWMPDYDPLANVRDAQGSVHHAVVIDIHDWTYARLARRGDDLLLLVPTLTRRQVDRIAECDCDGMPRVMPLTPVRVVFLVEGAPKATLQRIDVAVTEDYINFQCQRYLM